MICLGECYEESPWAVLHLEDGNVVCGEQGGGDLSGHVVQLVRTLKEEKVKEWKRIRELKKIKEGAWKRRREKGINQAMKKKGKGAYDDSEE